VSGGVSVCPTEHEALQGELFPGDAGGWWARQDLNLGPTVAFRKAMLLIRLASSCVMDHGYGGISRVLFSNGSRV
jgi:hypothetical protein